MTFKYLAKWTRCRPNGTWPYWPAVQCRPPTCAADGPPAGRVTDDDRRRRQTPVSWTIVAN